MYLLFLSTCCSYNLYRLIGLFPFQQLSGGLRFLRQQVTSVILFLLCAAGMIGCMLQEPALGLCDHGHCGDHRIASQLFPLSFFCLHFSAQGFLKTVLLAGHLGFFVTVFWPLASDGSNHGKSYGYCSFREVFIYVFILCIIFDARDLKTDLLRALGSLVTSVSRTSLQVITILSFVCYMSLSILLSLHLRHPSFGSGMGLHRIGHL